MSEDSAELKMCQEEITKLKSENDKFVKKIEQLTMKSVEVIIHAYSHNATYLVNCFVWIIVDSFVC